MFALVLLALLLALGPLSIVAGVDSRIDDVARDERQQAYDQQQCEDDDTEHILIVPDVLHQHKSGFHRL